MPPRRRSWMMGLVLGMIPLSGCVETFRPIWIPEHGIRGDHLPNGGILVPTAPPAIAPPAPPPEKLPESPMVPEKPAAPSGPEFLPFPAGTRLQLPEVLVSVEKHFPLILAAEEERAMAAGNRLASEGAFDLILRGRGSAQGGTFPNERLDVSFEQPTPFHGVNLLTGYRWSQGDFPVYYGDRKTADGGEFRAGLQIPLLKDRAIDRRRAALLQAKIAEDIADPVVQKARIDAFRAGAKAYWDWVGTGALVQVSQALLRIASERQAGLEEQFKRGLIPEFIVIDNRRLILDRQGALLSAERRFQQATFNLSLYLRDEHGNPVVVPADRLPGDFEQLMPPPMPPHQLTEDIAQAWKNRPELLRFTLQRERLMVDLRMAENLMLPALNAGFFAAQDVGYSKPASGSSALDRTVYEGAVTLEVPLQRREAQGKILATRAAINQNMVQERFARDTIQTEVLDAHSNLDRTYQRILRAREEKAIAERVNDLELERFRKGQGTLLEVNLRELSAAGARGKVIETLSDYYRALADYRAALGWIREPGH